MLYLDHAASTPLLPELLRELELSLANDFANPSASHKWGKDLFKKIEECRSQLKKALGAKEENQFIFTSSATEANNTILKGKDWFGRVFYNPAEHPSIASPIKVVAKLQNLELMEIPNLEDGRIDEEKFLALLNEETSLVCLAHVNNQTGNLHDLKTLVEQIKSRAAKSWVHVDAVQSFCKFPIHMNDWKVDSVTVSGHKVNAPKGIGALCFKNSSLRPLLDGGGHEAGLRSSTSPAPLIFSLARAWELQAPKMENALETAKNWNQEIQELILKYYPKANFPFAAHSSPYVLGIFLEGLSSDIFLRTMEMNGVALSSSSACSSKVKGMNPVLDKLGIPLEKHKAFIRLSFGKDFDQTQFDQLEEALGKCMQTLSFYLK